MGILVDLAAFRTRRAERAARAVAAPKDPMADILGRIERLRPLVLRAEVAKDRRLQTELLATIGAAAVRRVIDLWAERTTELLARPEVRTVLVFENRGPEVGATIPHPHGQIYGLGLVTPVQRREAEVAGLQIGRAHV